MLTAAHVEPEAPPPPVRLDVTLEGGQAMLYVIGSSSQQIKVEVDLAVMGGSSLRTKSRTTLAAGAAPVTLSRASIDAGRPWTAHLRVTADGMAPYEIIRRGDAGTVEKID